MKPGDVIAQTVRSRYSSGISFFYGVVAKVDDAAVYVYTPGWFTPQPWALNKEGITYRVIAPEDMTVLLRSHLRDHMKRADQAYHEHRSEGSDA